MTTEKDRLLPSDDGSKARWAKVRQALDIINASTVDCMACDEAVVLLADAVTESDQ